MALRYTGSSLQQPFLRFFLTFLVVPGLEQTEEEDEPKAEQE